MNLNTKGAVSWVAQPCDCADDDAQHETLNNGFAPNAEFLLNCFGVCFNFVEAGDKVNEFVDRDCDRNICTRESVRNGNVGEFVNILDCRSCPVCEPKNDGCVEDCKCKCKAEAAAQSVDHGAGECEVPEVPDVDVECVGEANCEQNDVDENTERNDIGSDCATKGDSCCCRPTDVYDVEFNTSADCQCLGCRAKVVAH